jgi:membrane fusion protein, multidrug efflux system
VILRVLLVSMATSAALAACGSKAPARLEGTERVQVHCEATQTQTVEDTVPLRGRIQPPPGGDLPIASQVPGRIAQILVREGQAIKEGDVVATVDDANSRDAFRQADAALDQARASETTAQATLARTQALVTRGIAPRQELDDAMGKASEAKAAAVAASATADLARRALGRVAIRSSLAGTVLKIWRGPGALVDGTAATPVAELAATGAVEFVAAATAPVLARVMEGDALHGTLGRGSDFEGAVIVRGRAVDPATGLGSLRAAVSGLGPDVLMGSYARANVVVDHRAGVRTLPTTALRGAVLDGAEVAVCKEARVEIRKVCVGWRDDARFEVCDGIGPGEKVAVDHVLGLEDGTAIAEIP